MKRDSSELTPRQREQIQALANLPDDQIDLSEVPETVDWSNARRGAFYTPGENHVGREIPSTTDTTEKGLESLIVKDLTGETSGDLSNGGVNERPSSYGAGWLSSDSRDYDREYCVDVAQLSSFLEATQPEVAESLDLTNDTPTRNNFLSRLQGEITKRGTVDVLRKGIKHEQHSVELFYGTPSPGNDNARVLYGKNRFSVTRQLHYSRDQTQHSLDLCLFINGLPVATFELKNSLTKQTVADAVEQYKRDRDPREKLFELGRCLVHFAVDDNEVEFCTQLAGKQSWFLPFNLGRNDGAGNPTNPNGLKTDYLWKQVLTRDSLTNIIENYALLVESDQQQRGRKQRRQIWPRYHQLDVVRRVLEDVNANGVNRRYLIQHSAGSGKSNSIAWLAHQLIGLERDRKKVLDSVIVVTDRKILDRQIRDTIRQFAQVRSVVGHAQTSKDLRALLESGKCIVITTVQKFPLIVDAIGNEHRSRNFGIIIDEAHSSQGGRTAASMSMTLGEAGVAEDEETFEDKINRVMESRKLLTNASYFAFTATPKNKTLEIFGTPEPEAGKVKHVPFHSYTMKQAIEENFIVDVLKNYTPVNSYYRLVKTVEADPQYDTKKAATKLRRYVENNDHAIKLKAEIVVDHFHEQVLGMRKIGGQARAMVVTGSVNRAIDYFHHIQGYLQERKSPYRAIVAFSGEHDYEDRRVTESSLNGFPSGSIAEKIQEDPYRFLVCADKFQTGYDEPLLHTMYVDKILSGIKAVQTLSRLNRSHPKKHDAFVLDFTNDVDTIREGFSDYYRTTVLSDEADPNRLHDLKAALDGHQAYDAETVESIARQCLAGADRAQLDSILDQCVEVYREDLKEDAQVDFKGKAKGFLRSYAFLGTILPYTNAEWEKLSIFLELLVPKLPAPLEDDLSKGILETIDMDSYRVEKQAVQSISLDASEAEIDPVTTGGGGQKPEPELDLLSNILREFNDLFGNVDWKDKDRIERVISQELPNKIAQDLAYRNAMENSDEQNARIESDKAAERVITALAIDDTELLKQFSDSEDFRRHLLNWMFTLTYGALKGGDSVTNGG